MQFGRVIDATLMMDKDTGRPRGFGFVTFDGEEAVDRALSQPLQIYGKPMEVKRAQPRSTLQAEEKSKFGRQRDNQQSRGNDGGGSFDQQSQMGGGQGMAQNGISPAMMAKYWFNMQQYFKQMQQNMQQQNMMAGQMGMPNPMAGGQMNPAMMAQMMGQQGQGMNPAMMQQMAQMSQQQAGNQGNFSPQSQGSGGGSGNRTGYSPQEQMAFEQQKYERKEHRMQQPSYPQQNFNQGGPQTWDGMYDDVPQPNMPPQGPSRGGQSFGRGGFGRGGRQQNNSPSLQQPSNAPMNYPTGPKNAGRPGSNYRGGGRGAQRGFHPYSR